MVFENMLEDTNFSKQCPYVGTMYIKNAHLSYRKMGFALKHLVPAGRYLVDLLLMHKDRQTIYLSIKTYLSISDNRIEQFKKKNKINFHRFIK